MKPAGFLIASLIAVALSGAAQAATTMAEWRTAISEAMAAAAGELRAACTP